MAQGKTITTKQWKKFLKVLEEQLGLISAACKELNFSRASYYKHRSDNSEFRKKADLIMNEICTPFTEDKLREAIFNGEGWAIKFYLQCKSRKWRPYEKREISGKLHAEVEQKIRVDPTLKKAVKFYEEKLKEEYRGRDSSRKHPGVDKKRRNKKRKRPTH